MAERMNHWPATVPEGFWACAPPAVYAAFRYDGEDLHRVNEASHSIEFCRVAADYARKFHPNDTFAVFDCRSAKMVWIEEDRPSVHG